MPYIPLTLAFCPIESEVLLAVGLSDGSIKILNEQLQDLACVGGHEQAVNSLAWEHKVLTYEKNKWITNNFSHVTKTSSLEEPPLLASGSSDGTVKLWRWDPNHQNGLVELYRLSAHHKAVRDLQWKPSYLLDCDKFLISCS